MRFEDDYPTLKKWAPRYLRRAHAAGARSVGLEDVVGEMSLAWTIASQKFDASLGVPWRAYLARGLMNHVNRWIDDQIGHSAYAMSLDAGGDSEEGSEAHEWLVSDDSARPDELLEEKHSFERALSELSIEAATFVKLLNNPPAFLFEELQAIQCRAKTARERGIASSAPKAITGNLILDFMGIGQAGRNRIYAEIKEVSVVLQTEINQ
ncbi:hypothetical protein [Methylobacterium sp. AMS5]|uniref:hypothetical protein n=1 Tax=Methylobacterium sp. AMS5 TaxID=925818 RepID=UPI00074F880B|nr:hypothetical protein [Methylobacterium sp. AMS5]AMB48376.1 hypothetical protein Y590_25745 [Methylobacterium sp. AMS5]